MTEHDPSRISPPVRTRRWRRRLPALALAGLLTVTVPLAGATAAAQAQVALEQSQTSSSGTSSAGTGTDTWSPETSDGYGASGSDGYGSDGYGHGGYGNGSGQDGYSQDSTSSSVDSDPASTAESVGVVLIDTQLTDGQGAGTGMVLTSGGQVLTNYHVVEGASAITVTVASTGTTYTASVLGSDADADVALLQLDDASGLTVASIDGDSPAVGDEVTAVGNAGGTGTLTAADGTVTSLTAQVTTQAEGAVDSETLTKLIQTSADVVAGDSGGPLLDADGEVIGIDTAASTGSEIDGYAIPIDTALAVVDQIRTGQDTASVQVGAAAYLGVQIADTAEGATVAGVEDGTAAADAGLEAGSVITALGDTEVSQAADVSTAVRENQPGDRVEVQWDGPDGVTHHATVTLGSSPLA